MNLGKIINYPIVIQPTDNMGFMVEVGCARLSYTDTDEMLKDLNEYLKKPGEIENRFNKIRERAVEDRPRRRWGLGTNEAKQSIEEACQEDCGRG